MTAMAQPAHADAPHHDATSYVAIWGVLCALLGVSVLGPMVGVRILTLITAFGIAHRQGVYGVQVASCT